MKHMKKFTAMLLAVIMVLGMALSASAADETENPTPTETPTTTITISGGANGSEYAAYKLLNATHDGGNKYAYTLNDKYTDILKEATPEASRNDIIAYISGLDVDGIRDFADAVYKQITEPNPDIEAEYTTTTNSFEVEQGYYLIAETKLGTTETGATDTFSLVMLDTAGDQDITVNTKEDLPTVVKKVEEKNDSTGKSSWGDSADHDLGDVIKYEITGTVSNKYADYESYYYSFVDTMVNGLEYQNNAQVYVVNGDSKVNVTEQFTINHNYVDQKTNRDGFTATANLKNLTGTGVTIDKDTKIVVEYTAVLTKDAESGAPGNPNYVYLEYENNPYHEGEGLNKPETPGRTPDDINIVFTYDAIVNKIDGETKKALNGAGFTLYKWIYATNEDGTVVSDWEKVGKEITGVTTFEFKKLDAGLYKLVETTVPDGYNKAEDVVFEIVATYNEETDPHTLTALTVKDEDGNVISSDTEGAEVPFAVNEDAGSVSTAVENNSGVELPETGGMGTTMFYAVGAVLVLAAVVLLVTKRRMRAE